MRQLLPGAAFLVVGVATLVAAPLGTVRHFHLNTEWALTPGARLDVPTDGARSVAGRPQPVGGSTVHAVTWSRRTRQLPA